MCREGSNTDYDSIKSRSPSSVSLIKLEEKTSRKLSSSSSSSSSSSRVSIAAQPVYSNTADPVYANAEKVRKEPSPPSTKKKGEEEDQNVWKREWLGKDQDKVDNNHRSTKEMKVEERRVVAKWESSSTASSSDNEDGGEMVVERIVDRQDGGLEDKEVAFKFFEFDISSSFIQVVWVDLGTDVEWARGSVDQRERVKSHHSHSTFLRASLCTA